MPFSTTAEFRTSFKSWSKRTELSDAEIDDFFALFEAEIFSEIRIRAMETVNAAFSVSSELTALPSGFKELRSIKSTSTPSYNLDLTTPQGMADRFQDGETEAPKFYLIEGDNLRINPPDGTYTLRLDYYKALTSITSGTLNWLATNFPNVYLFGALRYYTPYTGEDERKAQWEAWYQDAKAKLIAEDARSKRMGSQPSMKLRVMP